MVIPGLLTRMTAYGIANKDDLFQIDPDELDDIHAANLKRMKQVQVQRKKRFAKSMKFTQSLGADDYEYHSLRMGALEYAASVIWPEDTPRLDSNAPEERKR